MAGLSMHALIVANSNMFLFVVKVGSVLPVGTCTINFVLFTCSPNLCTPDITIKYISRYLGRPTIATSRIDKYDGEFVTFHYTRHEDDKTVSEYIPAMEFIQRLIVHIPRSILKCFATMASMLNITNRNRNFESVSPPNKKDIYVIY